MTYDITQCLGAQSAAFVVCLLGASALHKAVRWKAALAAARQVVGSGNGVAASVLVAALSAEAGGAALLCGSFFDLPAARLAGALLAAFLWSVYTAFIVRAIRQNRRDIDCGCSFGGGQAPLGRYHVVRNAVLIAAALLTGALPSGGATQGSGTILLAALTLLVLYAALDQIQTIAPLRTGETR